MPFDLKRSFGKSQLCINFEWEQGSVVFHDVFDNEHNVGGAQIKVEGVYIWPFRQLRLVANRYKLHY